MKRIYQKIVYEIFRLYFAIVCPLFYQIDWKKDLKGYVKGRPTIVAGNHPNTLLDPIFAGLGSPAQLNFLANTGLFQHWFSRFFFQLHFCIPVKRHNDPSLNGYSLNRSFELTSIALSKKKSIYVAVEGTSWRGYVLRPVRYGAEKIINDFTRHYNIPIQLLNVAINYSAPGKFRSVCKVRRMPVRSFKEPTPEGYISSLIDQDLRPQVCHWPEISMTEVRTIYDHLYPGKQHKLHWYKHFKKLCDHRLEDEDLKTWLNQLAEFIRKEGLTPPAHENEGQKMQLWLFPLHFIGQSICFIPRQLLYWIIKKINTYIEYEATIKVCVAPLLYFVFAMLYTWIVGLSFLFVIPWLFILYFFERVRVEYERTKRTYKSMEDLNSLGGAKNKEYKELKNKILQKLE